MGERTLQPLYHIDFIWNLTKSAKQLKALYEAGRNELKNVKIIFTIYHLSLEIFLIEFI